MADGEKVIKGLEFCTQHGSMCGSDCDGHYERYTNDGYVIKLVDEYRSKCPYGKCETGCVKTLAKDALELLKEQEPAIPKEERLNDVDSIYRCGNCGTHFYYRQQKYCAICGREAKWNATDW